jgi:hypothetical protein
MVTRAKPFVVDTKPVKQTRGRSLGSAKIAERAIRQYEQTINSLFGPEDYEAITTKVPLKPGADKVKLQLGRRCGTPSAPKYRKKCGSTTSNAQ